MRKAIPDAANPGQYAWQDFRKEEFVEIRTDGYLDVQMQYPALKMQHAEEKCYARKTVYEMLKKAGEMLPDGCRLRIWDAWRPFLLQKELYETYSETILKTFHLEKETKERQEMVVRKFVSAPVANRDMPPVHTTGGAVDVTIIDASGKELEMGSAFDEFTERTQTAYFENKEDEEIKRNRRLLYSVMTDAGFTNLPSEWWHYDYGDRFWAYYQEKPAVYRGVFAKEELYGTGRQQSGN